ncbi:hypothetical protein DPMN_126087 [Dreissena polymorpha]|uniref:IRG-type G domain-containing protein n=1 Tax=Dreissena polymorpha TaxID=45954 RepID=A0A9D4JVA3_DREPO|nr:hypothetical protein DPMN_126087 [Dreissena polymorpha]
MRNRKDGFGLFSLRERCWSNTSSVKNKKLYKFMNRQQIMSDEMETSKQKCLNPICNSFMENTFKFCSNCGANLKQSSRSSGSSQVIYSRTEVSNQERVIGSNDDECRLNGAEVALNSEDLQAIANDVLSGASDNADINEIRHTLDGKLTNLTNIKIHICIVGESGTGKSSFINAMLGLDSDDDGAAKVGLFETTQTPTYYKQINNPNLVFCDVPGVGTKNFPQKTYLKDINFDSYDFFILVTASRFKENDTWLANEIIKRKKRFYFVRAKIDLDIQCEFQNRRKPTYKSPDQLLQLLKEDCERQLKESGVPTPDVFLINNRNTQKYDFDALTKKLINDLPGLKKEALAWYLPVISLGVLEEKMLLFQKRIYKIALKSAMGAIVPIALVGLLVDVNILMTETQLYKAQFGTDDISMEILSRKLSIQLSDLINENVIDTSKALKSSTSFLNLCASMGAANALSNSVRLVLPGIGNIVSAPIAYCSSVYIQNKMLELCYAEAKRIFELRMKVYNEKS